MDAGNTVDIDTDAPANTLIHNLRLDLPGRFNEADLLRTQWPRILHALRGEILPPFEVLIHPSSACNLRCVWCIGDHVPIRIGSGNGATRILEASKTSPTRLEDRLAEPENMIRLLASIVGYRKTATCQIAGVAHTQTFGVENVTFSGLIGEPLASKAAVLRGMQFLVDRGLRVGLFTNGVLMDPATHYTILRTAYVHVSLDAGTTETYSLLKQQSKPGGRDCFGKVLANVRSLVEERAKSSWSKLKINASFVLYPENYHEVYQAARLLKSAGVDTLRIKQDNSARRLLTADQRRDALELLGKIQSKLEDHSFRLVQIHRLENVNEMKRSFPRCLITDLMAAVGSDGCLYPCNYHPRPGGASYGSAIERTFREVWEGDERTRIKSGIPRICPTVCDPFKNRANRLLNLVSENAGASDLNLFREQALGLLSASTQKPGHRQIFQKIAEPGPFLE